MRAKYTSFRDVGPVRRWAGNDIHPDATKAFEGGLVTDDFGEARTLLAAHPSFLPSLRGQYWQCREAAESMSRHLKRMETDEDYWEQQQVALEAVEHDPTLINHKIPGVVNPMVPSVLTGEVDPQFWEMRSTGIGMVIAAEGLTSISGLEDCDQLLLAA